MYAISFQSSSNWRDSDTGLANAIIPFDVNTALLPGALRAIQVGCSLSLLGWFAAPVLLRQGAATQCATNTELLAKGF